MGSKFKSKMDRIMFKVLPSCKEAMHLHSCAQDERLPLRKRFLLWMHCIMCRFCARYGKQLRLLRKWTKQLPEKYDYSKVAKLPDDAKERILVEVRRAPVGEDSD